MNKFLIIFAPLVFLLTGCETSDTSYESSYDRVSREIDRLKAESEAAAVAGGNIRIVVNMLTADAEDFSAVDSLWHYSNQNAVVIKRPQTFAASGLKIGLADENFRARLDITKRQIKSSEETELFIVLADGATGYINIGREIPVPRFYYHGRWYSSVGYEFRQAGRSLMVTTRTLPSGLIDMKLTPVFSNFLSSRGDMELTGLSTRVTAVSGQTIIIGGEDTGGENIAAALFGYSKSGKTKRTLITVTPYTQ
jgi:hypothetical protein